MKREFGSSIYHRRVIDTELDELFDQLPAILLDGPKGVGKTSTALQRASTVHRLDRDAERSILAADPSMIELDDPLVLIDEWHRLPSVWDAVRRAVDHEFSGGRFLLTGSAPQVGTHSGAGRIVALRMRPLCLYERGIGTPAVSLAELAAGTTGKITGSTHVGIVDYVHEIVAGGFPAMRGLSGRALTIQLESYLTRIVEHDFPELGQQVRRPATLMSWLRAYGAATATTASQEAIRQAATGHSAITPTRVTAAVYSELLLALRILDPLPAWTTSNNHLRALASAPKHHLTDPALAARLLRRGEHHLLSGDEPTGLIGDRPLLGRLFESLVAQSVRTYAQAIGADVFHLRTKAGRQEIDLILETSDGGIIAIEVKLAGDVTNRDVRHLHWLRDRIGSRLIDAVVVNTGPSAYRRPDGVAVIPLAILGP